MVSQDRWSFMTGRKKHDFVKTCQANNEIYVFLVKLAQSHYTGSTVVNSLWHSDTIWQHGSESTLVQVVTCLMAPSHYLNQCWLIIQGVLWHSLESYLTSSAMNLIRNMCAEITFLKLLPHLVGVNELTAVEAWTNIVSICRWHFQIKSMYLRRKNPKQLS